VRELTEELAPLLLNEEVGDAALAALRNQEMRPQLPPDGLREADRGRQHGHRDQAEEEDRGQDEERGAEHERHAQRPAAAGPAGIVEDGPAVGTHGPSVCWQACGRHLRWREHPTLRRPPMSEKVPAHAGAAVRRATSALLTRG